MQLDVQNLSKKFIAYTRGGVEIQGFKNVSFSLKKGSFVALCGSSGSGKSSVLKTLYRSYIPSSGDAILFVDNHQYNLATLSDSDILEIRKRYIGYVSQFLQVLPRISAVDIVAKPLVEKGESLEVARKRAEEMLDFFSIKEELFSISPLTFSGGEQQRVNIARGIIAPKTLLLLDEPTASLDINNRNKVLEKLKELKGQGVSMVGIFHDKESMEAISDTIYYIQGETDAIKK